MRLTLSQVSFRHPGANESVLRSITCNVPAGRSTAIVGPSGSGKTTLLALLGGLLPPQTGTFWAIDSEEQRHHPRDVSVWVLQSVNLLAGRTVLDNVKLGAYLDGLAPRQAQRRACEALERMGIAELASRPARLLSGGEAQRVGIARALASTRPLLFADEPTGQLDATTTGSVADALLASASRTMLIVTHDDALARRCDHVLRLADGTLTPQRVDVSP